MFGNNTRSDRVLRASTTSKRKAEVSPVKGPKRCALGDISNKGKGTFPLGATNATKRKVEPVKKSKAACGPVKKGATAKVAPVPKGDIGSSDSSISVSSGSSPADGNSSLYTTAAELSDLETTLPYVENVEDGPVEKALPDGVIDYDKECGDDPFQVGVYAADIFEYYKRREFQFPVTKYLGMQEGLNKSMRSILVDWLVEVQESFELNHETLYLAVKLVDLFLGKVQIKRDKLQLVGTAAFWIASKFDERMAPSIDDFCYVCDDAYSLAAILKMEATILKTLDYDIGIPLSYRFLRRYARCAKLDMEMLTLARYVLEMSLMEYDFIDVLDSMMASASLLVALSTHNIKSPWTPTLVHYSGYTLTDILDLANRLLKMLKNPPNQVKTIKAKYSNSVFFGVAKLALPDEIKM